MEVQPYIGEVFVETCLWNITSRILKTTLKGEVETDESLFGRRTTYHRGNPRGLKIWILGIVERESNRLKLLPVDKRDAETLTAINKDNVVPGTTAVTDGWAAYKGLSEQVYKHYVVQHKRSFSCQCRDEQTGQDVTIHINRIQGAWKHAEDYFKHMNGTKVTQFEGHLCEIMWRWCDRRPKLEAILKLIIQYSYPLSGPPIFTAGYPYSLRGPGHQHCHLTTLCRGTRHQLTKTVTQKHSQVLPRAVKSAFLVCKRGPKHSRSRPPATQDQTYLHRWSL